MLFDYNLAAWVKRSKDERLPSKFSWVMSGSCLSLERGNILIIRSHYLVVLDRYSHNFSIGCSLHDLRLIMLHGLYIVSA